MAVAAPWQGGSSRSGYQVMVATFGSKARPLIHIRCSITASLRANATRAFQKPDLRPMAAAQSFSGTAAMPARSATA